MKYYYSKVGIFLLPLTGPWWDAIYWVGEAETKFMGKGSVHDTVGGDMDKFRDCVWCLLYCAYCPSWTATQEEAPVEEPLV
jgi:hypothetical protein